MQNVIISKNLDMKSNVKSENWSRSLEVEKNWRRTFSKTKYQNKTYNQNTTFVYVPSGETPMTENTLYKHETGYASKLSSYKQVNVHSKQK